jgi:2-isopropylmalate synthase
MTEVGPNPSLNLHGATSHFVSGTGIASAELGFLAGGDRIEGCLFGNGERTGNVDLVNLALNLYSQGIKPNVDFSDIQSVIDVVTKCNDLPIHPRHPYSGELVFTSFSGSHQDAIKKGFEHQQKAHASAAAKGEPQYWNIPYLAVDPADIGTDYEAVIRVNSQSGKGGIAYIVKQHLHLDLPRKMQIAFYKVIQSIADREAREVTVEDITSTFKKTYSYGGSRYEGRLALRNFNLSTEPSEDASADHHGGSCKLDGTLSVDGSLRVIRGDGNGPISALHDALVKYLGIDFSVKEYSNNAIGEGQDAQAVSYVEIVPPADRKSSESWWGVGVDSNIAGSGLRAFLSAVNNAIGDRALPELKLNVGYDAKLSEVDVASILLTNLGLELPRRLQTHFFEAVQKKAAETSGELPVAALLDLFRETYGYESKQPAKVSISTFNVVDVGYGGRRALTGDFDIHGQSLKLRGEGNGPISAALDALRSRIDGAVTVKEYSVHSIGEGSDVLAASYVELIHEVPGSEKTSVWGVATSADITASGLMALMNAVGKLYLAAASHV